MSDDHYRQRDERRLVSQLVAMTVEMFGFGYLLVPLYDVFCDITGLNGRTGDRVVAAVEAPDLARLVTVEFITAVGGGAAWVFHPVDRSMEVHPGKLYTATFYAENPTESAVIGQAVPSVAPGIAAKYFQKTDCFCFDQQAFKPREGREMVVRFIIDPELPPEVETVSLAYTLYNVERLAATGTGS